MIYLNILQNWMSFLGHFHPLVVHLPIGILMIVFIMEILQWRKPENNLGKAIRLSLVVAFITGVISCIVGFFLSQEGGYEENTLLLHQWMGISLTLFTGISWLLYQKNLIRWYRAGLVVLFLALMITGHQGGNMTHGDDYLTAGLPGLIGGEVKKINSTPVAAITDIQQAQVYKQLVVPVLANKCYSCHSSAKIKGALRLDEEKHIFKGGKHGTIIEPGNAANSEFIKRLLLSREDDKLMPPKDQEPLTKEEITLLTWWVESGSNTSKKVAELNPDSSTLVMLNSFVANHGTTPAQKHEPEALSAVFEKTVSMPDNESVEALRNLSVLVSPVAQNSPFLMVSCVNFKEFDNKTAQLLLPLKDNIVWLQVENTMITDDALAIIAQMPNLIRLNLSATSIGTEGIKKLQALSFLEYININHTKADNKTLEILQKINSLKNIYCWKTSVTPEAVGIFRTQKPETNIIQGIENL
ncbi:c-type cytochrome domain-containing protein [Gynurincola endophyticus]|uniref:c-type cytochrome domain-containing protein n=1 Tax=Gynurincola endophyticus TaxID=2479004 RepID=UPI000F8E3DD3|nr:c-type cytochrome domain-containing protein [Gynurincola endophyticus]